MIVLAEVTVLALNHLRCPLTHVAARYATDRQDSFDIYLPLRLARYTKHIFGLPFLTDPDRRGGAVWDWLRARTQG